MIATIGLLLAGVTVGIHVEEARDLPEPSVQTLINTLAVAIEDRTGEAPFVHAFDVDAPCAEACVLETVTKIGAREVVSVRVLAVPSKIRFIAELRDRDLRVVRRAQVDVAHDRALWPTSMGAVAIALFPTTLRRHEAQQSTPRPSTQPGAREDVALVQPVDLEASRRWPWWLIGGGALAGGVAVVLGVENRSARDEGSQPGVPPARVEELRDVTHATGLGANVLFGVAATSLITGAILLITD